MNKENVNLKQKKGSFHNGQKLFKKKTGNCVIRKSMLKLKIQEEEEEEKYKYK